VHTSTFHHLCISEAANAALQVPIQRDEEWWDKIAPALLVEAATRNGLAFDAIVVDEGQDFSEDWIAALQLLSSGTTDAPMYVFADQHQRLYRRRLPLRPCDF
jgi:superfamily I DNA/RNA helicase